jgi:hypothetical protein
MPVPVTAVRSRWGRTAAAGLAAIALLTLQACGDDAEPDPRSTADDATDGDPLDDEAEATPDPEDDATPPTAEPTATEPPDEAADGLQEIGYADLTLRVPEEWVVHELSYDQMPMDGGDEVTDDWLLIQTDPDQTCDLDEGITPGVDYGCDHVMVLGPGSIAVGHGLGELTEDNPFALGTNPGPCSDGIGADLPEPDDLSEPLTASDASIGDETVPYREWPLACLEDMETFDMAYHLQRTWYLPDALIVDNWSTPDLEDYVTASELS